MVFVQRVGEVQIVGTGRGGKERQQNDTKIQNRAYAEKMAPWKKIDKGKAGSERYDLVGCSYLLYSLT